MKILIGGIPYGKDNVGDEAILATVVSSIRKAFDNPDITVSTGEPETTAKKLSVRTVPLLGFPGDTYSEDMLNKEMKNADIFIWGGATGLSDYPETALHIAETALKNNARLVLYSVGMNDNLNPAFYKLSPSPKKTILDILNKVSLGTIDIVKKIEKQKEADTRRHIKNVLDKADIVICRDIYSKRNVLDCDVENEVYSTADPAILLPMCSDERLEEIWTANNLWKDGKKIIGICISAQRKVRQMDEIVNALDELIEAEDANVLCIPMNDKTDYFLLEELRKQMKHSDRTGNLKGRYEPEEITKVASKTSLIISSRLHLLILASITNIPIVGLSRGTKIDRFLKEFDEKPPGSVESFNYQELLDTSKRLLKEGDDFRRKSVKIVKDLKSRAEHNIELLKQTFSK